MDKIKDIMKHLYNKHRSNSKKAKLKPTKTSDFIKLIERQNQSKNIVTVGVFKNLNKDVRNKIHDKKLYETLTNKDYSYICSVILKNIDNPSCYIKLTEKGKYLLNLTQNDNYSEIKKLKFRTIFNTLERQISINYK